MNGIGIIRMIFTNDNIFVFKASTPGPLYVFFRTDNQVTGVDGGALPSPDPDFENGFQLQYTILRGRNCQ